MSNKRWAKPSNQLSIKDRFWKLVNKTPTCWLWTGATDGVFGYGRLRVGVREKNKSVKYTISTHRVSYELAYGPIPEGLSVLHKCDNPLCVRPDHLFLGTQIDNMHDRFSKGHYGRSARAKLTDSQVRDIRALYWESTEPLYSLARLGKDYGISTQGIFRIVNFKNYRDVL